MGMMCRLQIGLCDNGKPYVYLDSTFLNNDNHLDE